MLINNMWCKLKGRKLQYMSTIFGSISVMSVFMALIWSAPAGKILLEEDTPLDRPITLTELGTLFVLMTLGSVLGNICLAFFINLFGRKGTMLINAFPILVSWLMIYFGTNVPTIMAARFITGFALAFPVNVITIYIGEIADPDIRGKLSFSGVISATIGIIITLSIGPYYYHALALTGIVITIIGFILFYFMPESPLYYIKKNNISAAEESLLRLRDTDDVSEELKALKNSVEENMRTRGTVKDIFMKKSYRKAFFIALGLKTLQEVSGGHFVEANLTQIFAAADTGLDDNMQSLVVNLVIIPFLFLGSFLIERFGRKILLYMSTIGFSVCAALDSTYFFLNDANLTTDSMAFLPITAVIIGTIFRLLGIASVAVVMMGELFPPNIKGIASSIVLVYGSALGALLALLFNFLAFEVGLGACFLFFAVCCLGGCVFTVFFVPETKGKTLDEIHQEFEKL